MKISNISFPYPVLGVNDDVLPKLPNDCVVAKADKSESDYILTVTLNYDNRDIKCIVQEGKAQYCCECECQKTLFRKCFKSSEPTMEIKIPRKSVLGRVSINFYVAVTKEIKGYSNSGFNDDYEGMTFDMEPGDILAAFPETHYDTDIAYEKLQAAGSFMVIREGENKEDIFFDLSDEKIQILMPQSYYKAYSDPSVEGAAPIIHSSIVLNALTYALTQLFSNEDEYKQKRWAKTIYYRLKTEDEFKNFSTDSCLDAPIIAQRFLKDPYMRLFKTLKNQNTETSEV